MKTVIGKLKSIHDSRKIKIPSILLSSSLILPDVSQTVSKFVSMLLTQPKFCIKLSLSQQVTILDIKNAPRHDLDPTRCQDCDPIGTSRPVLADSTRIKDCLTTLVLEVWFRSSARGDWTVSISASEGSDFVFKGYDTGQLKLGEHRLLAEE